MSCHLARVVSQFVSEVDAGHIEGKNQRSKEPGNDSPFKIRFFMTGASVERLGNRFSVQIFQYIISGIPKYEFIGCTAI